MKFIDEMERTVLTRWSRANFDCARLPEIATEALQERLPSSYIDPVEIVEWAIKAEVLPAQFDLAGRFGQPPISLNRSDRLVIQALFWLDGTTSIHQHGFSGAFHVLSGASIHSRYSFRLRHRINERTGLGDIRFDGSELLNAGATRPIVAGDQFIHSLFHLDRPSVTLVVRTRQDPGLPPQYSYERPHLAHDPFWRPPDLARRLQVLGLAEAAYDDRYLGLARELVSREEFSNVPPILVACAKARGLAFVDELVDIAATRFGDPARLLLPVVRETMRQGVIIERRKAFSDPHHRYLLALLLNVPDRQTILDMLAASFPGEDPSALVVRWLHEMSTVDPRNGSSPNPLGHGFTEAELTVLQGLVRGLNTDGVVDELRRRFDDVDGSLSDVESLCAAFKASPVLGVLC